MNRGFALCFCFVFWVTGGVPVAAQEEPFPFPDSARYYQPDDPEGFESLKQEAAALISVNKKLEEQFRLLRDKSIRLQALVEEYRREVEALAQDSQQISSVTGDRPDPKESRYQPRLSSTEDEIILNESKNRFLVGQLINLDEHKRLWELQRQDLEYQKRDLEMQLKLKQFKYHELKREREKAIQSLRNQLKSNYEQVKFLEETKASMEKELAEAPKDTYKLTEEVINLQTELEIQKTKRDITARERDILGKKRLLMQQTMDAQVNELQTVNHKLQNQLASLNTKYETTTESLQDAVTRQFKQQKIVSNIMTLDQENRELMEKIKELRDEIKKLEEE